MCPGSKLLVTVHRLCDKRDTRVITAELVEYCLIGSDRAPVWRFRRNGVDAYTRVTPGLDLLFGT